MEWRETITYEICQERNVQGPIAPHEIRYFFFNALDWIFLERTHFWMKTHTDIHYKFVFFFSFLFTNTHRTWRIASLLTTIQMMFHLNTLSSFERAFIFNDLSIQPMFVFTIKIIFSWLSMMIQSIRWIRLHLFSKYLAHASHWMIIKGFEFLEKFPI